MIHSQAYLMESMRMSSSLLFVGFSQHACTFGPGSVGSQGLVLRGNVDLSSIRSVFDIVFYKTLQDRLAI